MKRTCRVGNVNVHCATTSLSIAESGERETGRAAGGAAQWRWRSGCSSQEPVAVHNCIPVCDANRQPPAASRPNAAAVSYSRLK